MEYSSELSGSNGEYPIGEMPDIDTYEVPASTEQPTEHEPGVDPVGFDDAHDAQGNPITYLGELPEIPHA